MGILIDQRCDWGVGCNRQNVKQITDTRFLLPVVSDDIVAVCYGPLELLFDVCGVVGQVDDPCVGVR